MEIKSIKISNILGITDLEFKAGQFNVVSAKNGCGKTSILESIKAALKGGHDATLLRNGEDSGEVVLVLDDGTSIRKRVGEKSSTSEIRQQDGKKLARPGEQLQKLVDMLSVNPVEFLTSRKQDRVKVLLEAMPIVAEVEVIKTISGIEIQPSAAHGLDVIEGIRKEVYDVRTGTNRAVKEKEATIKQLSNALPEIPGIVSELNEDDLRLQIEEQLTVKNAEVSRIESKLEGIKAANAGQIDQIKAEAQAQIEKIKEAAQAQIDGIRESERETEKKAMMVKERAILKYSEAVLPLQRNVDAIVGNRNAVARREQTLETIQMMERELEDLKQDSEEQTLALKNLEAYKNSLIESLPIPGLEIKDGEIYRHGVQFDRLNTAQQVQIAVEVAKLRAGELGIVCVDGLELLDTDSFNAFRDTCKDSGLQLFVSRVSDDEQLTIEEQ